MGARSCGHLRSRVPALLDFSFAFRVPAFLYNIFFAFRCAPAFLFHVPSVCVGMGEQLITRALFCMDGSGGPGQLAILPLPPPPPRHACTVYESTGGKPVWGQTRFSSTIPPSTSPLSTRHSCVISSQKCEFSIPILSHSAFPSSCIIFAFLRTRVPKIPGTRERGNAKPGTRAHLGL